MTFAAAHQVTLDTSECCKCGVTFAFPWSLMRRLRENGGTFYCPSGHAQHFTVTEADRLRKLLEEANRSKTRLVDDYAQLQREHRRLQKRVSAGVCPCCNRTFTNLARHIASKHRELTP
ncbi:hypothetical protein [Paraburkholderia sp.]|jgi:hypothetical protein|uniref:hypothetical protein n=1 Tax=Paraburkholderia sp. TaxID=1926495 RepID=UPI002F42A91C